MKSKFVLTTSFDRTVYPPKAILHLRAAIDKKKDNTPIIFKIFNFEKKLIVTKKVYPNKTKPVEFDKSVYIYETSVKMDSSWNIGKQYSLITTYGDSSGYSKMIIAKRNSSILPDRNSYILGSDAIITVIAPDFDLDSDRVETIGNKKNNLITISTSKGTISGYALRETGHSTGIFQGTIRILPPEYSKDGKKKSYPKAMGKGPNDGSISATIDEKITIEFKNEYETIKEFAYVSNFGAAIELDQKMYDSNDKVYLTIVAPDCNFDPRKIDSIGNKKDNEITISTSQSIIKNYELKETGKDTGIFAGELELFDVSDTKRSTTGKGSTDGKLLCKASDSITITFVFESQQYVASALIKRQYDKYQEQKLYFDLKNLFIYLSSIEDNVYRFNEIPPPKQSAHVAPEFTYAEREIFLRMELESFRNVLDSMSLSLQKSRKSVRFEWGNMISDIIKYLEKIDVTFKDDKAYISNVSTIKNHILNLLKKLPKPTE